MDLITWYVPRGRITRRVFWLHYVLPFFLLSLLALAVDVSFGYTSLDAAAAQSQGTSVIEYGPFVTGVAVLTIVPSIASQVTRLHDQGRSAWWLLLNLVPVVGQVALLVLCGFVPGQPVANRYGPPTDGSTAPPGWDAPAQQPGTWAPGPQDRAPDYPPPDWR